MMERGHGWDRAWRDNAGWTGRDGASGAGGTGRDNQRVGRDGMGRTVSWGRLGRARTADGTRRDKARRFYASMLIFIIRYVVLQLLYA